MVSSRAVAYVALVLTSALWGSNGVAARGLLNDLSPATLALLRWGIGMVALAPFVWKERAAMLTMLRRHWKILLLLGVTGFAPNSYVSYLGLRGSTAIMMGLMNSIVPVVVLLMVAVWKHRIPRRLESIGMSLSFIGVFAVLIHGDFHQLLHLDVSHFDLIVLLGLIIWAVYSVLVMERPEGLTVAGYTFLVGVISLFIIAPAVVEDWTTHGLPQLTHKETLLAIYIALAPSLLAMLLFGYAVEVVGPVQCGIFTHLVPLFSAIFAMLFLGETLHIYHIIGFFLIVGGAVLCCLKPEAMVSSAKPHRSVDRL